MEDVRSFILPINDGSSVEEFSEAMAEMKKTTKARPKAEYEVLFATGPDFAVRKKTPRACKLLVCILSQNQLYFKNEKTGEISPFSTKEYASFMTDVDDSIRLKTEDSHCTWLDELCRGTEFAQRFETVYNSLTVPEVKERLLPNHISFRAKKMTRGVNEYTRHINKSIMKKTFSVLEKYVSPVVLAQLIGLAATDRASGYSYYTNYEDQATSKALTVLYTLWDKPNPYSEMQTPFFDIIVDTYGLDGFAKYLDVFMESNHTQLCGRENNSSASTYFRKRMHSKTFELNRLLEYLFYESAEQGFARDANNFLDSWMDTLNMQEQVYGKIVDKYPENLLAAEKRMAYKVALLREKVDEEHWANAVENMKRFEYKGAKYSIVSPKTRADMTDEAQQQSNCLAGYIRSVAEGECMIFFCRKNSSLDSSFVTVEVTSKGVLGQVKARFNKEPPVDALAFVEKWYNEVVSPEFFGEKPAIAS